MFCHHFIIIFMLVTSVSICFSEQFHWESQQAQRILFTSPLQFLHAGVSLASKLLEMNRREVNLLLHALILSPSLCKFDF